MRTIILTLIFSIIAFQSQAQTDQVDRIYKHNGDVVEAYVLEITEYGINFVYPGEDVQYTLSKHAVEKIFFGQTQRVEIFTDKIDVSGKDGWKNVVILYERTDVAGLEKGGEIRGRTALINWHTIDTGDQKATEKLKKRAAAMGYPFVIILTEKIVVNGSSGTIYESEKVTERSHSRTSVEIAGNQVIKTGIAYGY